MNIVIGADHGGYALKEQLKISLLKRGHTVDDVGSSSSEATDYPIYAQALASKITKNKNLVGILICRSGIGMAIQANRYQGVRAFVCHQATEAITARCHNHANVICFAADKLSLVEVLNCLEAFLTTPFSDEPRHCKRVTMLDNT